MQATLQNGGVPTGSDPTPATTTSKEKRTDPRSTTTQNAELEWHSVGHPTLFPEDAGIAVLVQGKQIAVFRFAEEDRWFATDNHCPHSGDAVLARGLLGDCAGRIKVTCPLHKRSFDLNNGECLSEQDMSVRTYEVRVSAEQVEVLA